MSTPLYKRIKSSGTTFYCFPSSAEDISAAYQNSNYKMYFSKFALLNIPKQNLTAGTTSNTIQLDFDNSFYKSINSTPPSNFSDAIIESLRNYVANQEVVIKESRLNNTKYYYDTNVLETTTEKIFFKWCRKMNIIDFEPAIPDDEYFSNIDEFERNNIVDDEYFQEYLWKEREVISWDSINYTQSGQFGYDTKMEIEFNAVTNFKVGDKVRIYSVGNSTIYTNGFYNDEMDGSDSTDGIKTDILYIIPPSGSQGQRIIVDIDTTISGEVETSGQVELVYNRLVNYIGEISGNSNVQEANRNYTQVYAHIPDHVGQTPDVLFRTNYDNNYKPNLVFPILPSQYQAEILGAELFSSPIVSYPQNYPGSYFAQFDTPDFTYETSSGDILRRSGDYFGVSGNINNPIVNSSLIDGIGIDFNTSHYVKMNIFNRVLTNFDQFNALEVNNTPPVDFEFNAILWYYNVQKPDGNGGVSVKSNLYGISFLDNPDNNPITEELGLKFPIYKKLVSNGSQDGTSYGFSLNLNFNIINDNPQEAYNPEAINSLFGMNLFNKAMASLSATNDSFLNLISDQGNINDEITNLKGLLYTQTDISTINLKISNLEKLLRLYSTNQIVESDSIKPFLNPGSPASISLYSKDTNYTVINEINTTNLYNANVIIPYNLIVPENKNFLIIINNDDDVNISLTNSDKLTILLDKDLSYKQSFDIYITSSILASQNKKLDIYINTLIDNGTNIVEAETLLVGNIDLPVFYNTSNSTQNSAYKWKDFNFDIDLDQTINYSTNTLEIPLYGNQMVINNSIKKGDTLVLNNFFVGTSSVYDYSGQYLVSEVVGSTSSYIYLDISNNPALVSFGETLASPYYIHGTNSSYLSNNPYLSINKGKKFRITRVSSLNVSIIDKYQIDIEDIK